MRTTSLGLIGLLLMAATARAEDLPSYSIRSLAMRSSTIVLAEPADPAKLQGRQQQFKVQEVLKGRPIEAGTTITVGRMDLYQVGQPDWRRSEKTARPEVTRALLFLAPPQGTDTKPGRFDLLLSGMRYLTSKKEVLGPVQLRNPGGLNLVPAKDTDWDKLIAGLRADLPKIAQAMALKKISDPVQRNRAVFAWIEDHRAEFTGQIFARPQSKPQGKPGWAELEREPFEWILQTCRAEDGWRAWKLAREIAGDSGCMPDSSVATFASPEGRALLMGVITDPKQSEADRNLALDRLRGSCWARWQKREHPNLENISPQEQADIIEKISLLLEDRDTEVRRLAAKVLLEASSPRDGSMRDRDTHAAMPALIEAYRNEPPGWTRNEMAEIVCRMADRKQWEEISGNSAGLLVVLYSFGVSNNYGREVVKFSANMPVVVGGMKTIARRPTLIMERIGEGREAVEHKTMPFPVAYPKDLWSKKTKKAWTNHDGMISIEVPSESMAEGLWRFTVEGVAGEDDSQTWRSEPRLFELKRSK